MSFESFGRNSTSGTKSATKKWNKKKMLSIRNKFCISFFVNAVWMYSRFTYTNDEKDELFCWEKENKIFSSHRDVEVWFEFYVNIKSTLSLLHTYFLYLYTPYIFVQHFLPLFHQQKKKKYHRIQHTIELTMLRKRFSFWIFFRSSLTGDNVTECYRRMRINRKILFSKRKFFVLLSSKKISK